MFKNIAIVILLFWVGYFGGKSWALSERLKESEVCRSQLQWQVDDLNDSIVQGTCLPKLRGGL